MGTGGLYRGSGSGVGEELLLMETEVCSSGGMVGNVARVWWQGVAASWGDRCLMTV